MTSEVKFELRIALNAVLLSGPSRRYAMLYDTYSPRRVKTFSVQSRE